MRAYVSVALHKTTAEMSEVGLLPPADPRLNPGCYLNGAHVVNMGKLS